MLTQRQTDMLAGITATVENRKDLVKRLIEFCIDDNPNFKEHQFYERVMELVTQKAL